VFSARLGTAVLYVIKMNFILQTVRPHCVCVCVCVCVCIYIYMYIRRHKKLLDDLKDRRGYSHLKEEALERTMWRNRFGGGFEPVIRQNTEWMYFMFEFPCIISQYI
jgi:hypothetical protein